MSRVRLAAPFVVLTLIVAGCGGSKVTVQEVPGDPVSLSVPGTGEALAPQATATATGTATATPTATTTSDGTTTGQAPTNETSASTGTGTTGAGLRGFLRAEPRRVLIHRFGTPASSVPG